jgi:hypothetical protein
VEEELAGAPRDSTHSIIQRERQLESAKAKTNTLHDEATVFSILKNENISKLNYTYFGSIHIFSSFLIEIKCEVGSEQKKDETKPFYFYSLK